jgi:hypothetical protein
MKRQAATEEVSPPRLIDSNGTLGDDGYLGQPVAPRPEDRAVPRLHTLALEALAQIQAVLQTNTSLVQQSATLEEQIQLLLAERIALFERIEQLEGQLAERAGGVRQPIPFRPLANLPAVLHHERLEAVAFPRRFSRTTTSDEETLLGSATPTPAVTEQVTGSAMGGVAARDYALIARPFARFTDLGGFQSAVQALPGVGNVRVRRFAQGTLEMRVDYHGERPLAELLRELALPVAEIVQEGANRLHLRLASFDERSFPALS